MFGIVQCGMCRRPRIVNRDQGESTCPYCNCTQRHSDMRCVFESEDQAEAREALSQATGFTAPDPAARKRRVAEADPYSTMVYRYEHCSDMEERMTILARGLTEIKGTFTLDDVREVAGAKAERMVEAMLNLCIISEVRNGVYRA